MSDRRKKMLLGVFTAGSMAALTVLAVLFAGRPAFFSHRAQYVVLFSEAPGIAIGTPVRKSGVRIGDVRAIDLDEETGDVRVSIEIDQKFLPRQGEEPAISRGLLSGDTTLDIVPRSTAAAASRTDVYPPGTEIRGMTPVNTRTLLNQASGVIPTAQESMARLLQSMKHLDTVGPKAEKALDEFAEFAKSSREFIPELKKTNTKLQELLGDEPEPDPKKPPTNARALLKEMSELFKTLKPAADDIHRLIKDNGPEFTKTLQSLRKTSDSVDEVLNPENRKAISATLQNLRVASDDLTKTIRLVALLADQSERTLKELNSRLSQSERVLTNIDKITQPFAENSQEFGRDVTEMIRNLRLASEHLNKTLTDARSTMQLLNRPDGSLQKLLSDPSLYNNLNDTTVNASRTLIRLEQIAKDLQVFADKIARRPELLGAGGIVRPSTGVKESPLAPMPPSQPLPIPPTREPNNPIIAPKITPIPPVPLEPAPSFKQPVTPSDLPPR